MVVSRLSAMSVLEEPASLTGLEYVMFGMEDLPKMLAKMMQEGRLPRRLAKENHSKT